MSETEITDRLLSGEWVARPRALERLRTVPQHLEIVARPDGARVLVLSENGEEKHRLMLPPDAAAHLASLLVAA